MDGSDASAKFLSEHFSHSVPKLQIALPDTAADLLAQYDKACEQLQAFMERKQEAENLLSKCWAITRREFSVTACKAKVKPLRGKIYENYAAKKSMTKDRRWGGDLKTDVAQPSRQGRACGALDPPLYPRCAVAKGL